MKVLVLKEKYLSTLKSHVCYNKVDYASIWWDTYGLSKEEVNKFSDEEFEKLFLDQWYHGKKKDQMKHKGLFSYEHSPLQVFGCIQDRSIIVSINPSIKYHFIHVNLSKRSKVPTHNISSTHVVGEKVENFQDLKITMDKYVLHFDFHAIDMDNVDIVLGYLWMTSVGTIQLNIENKFLKI
jgi:hypothetical protein